MIFNRGHKNNVSHMYVFFHGRYTDNVPYVSQV